MRACGLKLKALTLNAREKICPMAEVRCDPDYCPRARGHFLRQEQGLLAAMKAPCWDTETVIKIADRHELCPFEFSLALCELADAVVCLSSADAALALVALPFAAGDRELGQHDVPQCACT